MSEIRKEAIKEEKADYRELFKNIFLLTIATITGAVTVIYKVVSKTIEPYMLFISALGFMSSVFLVIILKRIWLKMDNLTEELKNE